MKLYHLTCDWDFKRANLCSNSGIYSSREKAEEVIVNGLDWNLIDNGAFIASSERSLAALEKYDFVSVEEVIVE